MERLLANPAVPAAVIPFALGLVAALVLRFAFRDGGGGRAGAALVGAAILLAYVILEGFPPLPPVASKQKLGVLALVAVLAGAGLAPGLRGRWTTLGAALAFAALSLAWLGWSKMARSFDVELALTLIAALAVGTAFIAGVVAVAREEGENRTGTRLRAPSLLLVAAVSASFVSLFGAFAGMAQFAAALGAIVGAAALIAFVEAVVGGTRGLNLGAGAAFALAGSWVGAVSVMLLFARQVNPWALALAAGVAAMHPVAKRVPPLAPVLDPLIYGAIVAVPGALAVLLANLTGAPSSPY